MCALLEHFILTCLSKLSVTTWYDNVIAGCCLSVVCVSLFFVSLRHGSV